MTKIYLNEDNSHYFSSRKDKATDINEIENFINQYKDSNVEVLLLCPNSQITSFDSKVWNNISMRIDEYKDVLSKKPSTRNWAYAIKELIDKGIDIYTIWIELLRKMNIKPYISMRMNDVHNANDENDIMHSTFYKEHLNYRRNMYRDRQWNDRQLNYLIKEVRNYHMMLIEEYFERYDMDGFELDWMRFGNHFPTGYADEGRIVLNDFMKQVRLLADKYEKIRKHKIKIGVRCPIKPDTAFDLGMDAIYWAKQGYIDFVAPSPFWHTSQADVPIELWKYLLEGTGCLLAPCFEVCLRPYMFESYKGEYQFNTIETLAGPACSFIDRGADFIYYFNYMDKQPKIYNDETYKKLITIIGDYEKMKKLKKRYIVTFNDRKPDGIPIDIVLPKQLEKQVFTEYRVHTGNMSDRKKRFIVSSFVKRNNIKATDIKVYVNGYLCEFVGKYLCDKPYPVNTMYQWNIKEEAIKDGYQIIEYVALTDNLILDWVEMVIY